MSAAAIVLDALHGRIAHLLDNECPPSSWTPAEASQVLDTLAGIVAAREAAQL